MARLWNSLHAWSRLLSTIMLLALCSIATLACEAGGDGAGDQETDGDAIETDGDGTEPDGDDEIPPDGDTETSDGDGEEAMMFVYKVPLDPQSPWPKFRRTAAQTGRSELGLNDDGRELMKFRTGKGIFSSPVLGGDGTVYIGSADRKFYALYPDGELRWSFETEEIIDSSALLDDMGNVYFGSGDGYLYALDAQTGEEKWRFLADDPEERNAFIRWFEGNVALSPDGHLIVPNDNFYIYLIDRDTGIADGRIEMPDQTWALPAVDAENGHMYIGNNNVLDFLGNAFAYDMDGDELWWVGSPSAIVASPLLLSPETVIMSGFDGFTKAYNTSDGYIDWAFGARDHLYSSPSLDHDGKIIQASADGSIYCIDPADGSQIWAFDWGAPIRSSPAIDGGGNIYMGTGNGYLLVLNADGTLRWALRLIEEDRDDLNASPALGRHAVYIAGESGEIFGVPFDFCLREGESSNPGCMLGPDEPLPKNGATLLYTTNFGTTLAEAPSSINANQALAFSLEVRKDSETVNAFIDSDTLVVTVGPDTDIDVTVSANRRFLTVVPRVGYKADLDNKLRLSLEGNYLINPDRAGLSFTGGELGGSYEESFEFTISELLSADLPLPIPQAIGDPAGLWEMKRLAAPLPTLMPSYNQIGFDSLHFLVGLVEGSQNHAVGWVVEGRPQGEGGETLIDPHTGGVFPFEITYADGNITFLNQDGFTLEIMNAVLSFQAFRVSARLDEDGAAAEAATVHARTLCGDIPMYGAFLRILGLCHPESDLLTAFGAALLIPYKTGIVQAPVGLGEVELTVASDSISAALTGSTLKEVEHHFSLLLVDVATGSPVPLAYGTSLNRTAGEQGMIESLVLPFDRDDVPDHARVYLMVDTYPAYREEVAIPLEAVK